MDKYLINIDKQIEFNKGKNIFLDEKESTLKFIDDTVNVILNMSELTADSERILIDYATDKSLEEFCRINQYFTFNRQDRNDLRSIYCDLFLSIKTNKNSIESISKRHYDSIKQWLRKTNPFADKIYSNNDLDIKPVACSEYSAELQIKVLKIDIKTLMAPVLDIGCGRHGNMVNYLCNLGIDTHGIDRFSFSDSKFISSDWLEYNYGIEKWGTIVSNLGFSNHFKHHNLREDGNYIEYGKKYMDIIKSLNVGGRFHYAPDLPFIESYLDTIQYQIDKFEIGEFDFKTTVITRLK
ncbi:hypothetical protein D3C71_461960 [compost metagenome]